MTKNFFYFLGMLLILGLALGCRKATIQQACFQNYCFDLEIADEKSERSRGLMFRESLSLHAGMLFVFNKPGQYSFWMKNTRIPLDIIWLDENARIVDIVKNAQPCPESFCLSYTPKAMASYVLEIRAGIADELGIKEGGCFELKLGQ